MTLPRPIVVFAIVLGTLIASRPALATPTIARIEPAGAPRGAELEVVIRGRDLAAPQELFFESGKIEVAALEGVDTFPGRRSIADGQQLDREPNQANCDWQEQLVVCGLAARRAKSGGGHESDSDGQTEWTRPARVLERCADEVADTHEQPD